jgi:hypothetical protein
MVFPYEGHTVLLLQEYNLHLDNTLHKLLILISLVISESHYVLLHNLHDPDNDYYYQTE